jgi:hypothetical protein
MYCQGRRPGYWTPCTGEQQQHHLNALACSMTVGLDVNSYSWPLLFHFSTALELTQILSLAERLLEVDEWLRVLKTGT